MQDDVFAMAEAPGDTEKRLWKRVLWLCDFPVSLSQTAGSKVAASESLRFPVKLLHRRLSSWAGATAGGGVALRGRCHHRPMRT